METSAIKDQRVAPFAPAASDWVAMLGSVRCAKHSQRQMDRVGRQFDKMLRAKGLASASTLKGWKQVASTETMEPQTLEFLSPSDSLAHAYIPYYPKSLRLRS